MAATNKLTNILEQTQAEMSALFGSGKEVMEAFLVKAEKRVNACLQEFQQAQNVVDLTEHQRFAVDEARLNGEEKLEKAKLEEEDARLTAETVKRMIDDAATVRDVANKETAAILQRAEDVLDETATRAEVFYQNRKRQHEELCNAMKRLDATEKAVLYTLAKAERSACEKQLAHLIACKKHEVAGAEFGVALLNFEYADLEKSHKKQDDLLGSINKELQDAKAKLDDSIDRENAAAEDYRQRIQQCNQDLEIELGVLLEKEEQYLKDQQETVKSLENAELSSMEIKTAQEEALDNREKIRQASQDAIVEAKEKRIIVLAEIDSHLSEIEQKNAVTKDNFDKTAAGLDEAMVVAEKLRQDVADLMTKVAEAEAEEISARGAAETARRLAENAVKIRESLSSESSQLLLSAQEVLVEAANSAQQLMEEKQQLCRSAREDLNIMNRHIEKADSDVENAQEQFTNAELMLHQAEELFKEAIEEAKPKCVDIEQKTAEIIAQAEAELQTAEADCERLAQEAVQAEQKLAKVKNILEGLEEALLVLAEEKAAVEASGKQRLDNLNQLAEETVSKLTEEREGAQGIASRLQESYDSNTELLNEISLKIEENRYGLEQAQGNVQVLIGDANIEILSLEGNLQNRLEQEDKARRDAEKIASKMAAFVSPHSYSDFENSNILASTENITNLTDIFEDGYIYPAMASAVPAKEALLLDSVIISEEAVSEEVAYVEEAETALSETDILGEEAQSELKDEDLQGDTLGEDASVVEAQLDDAVPEMPVHHYEGEASSAMAEIFSDESQLIVDDIYAEDEDFLSDKDALLDDASEMDGTLEQEKFLSDEALDSDELLSEELRFDKVEEQSNIQDDEILPEEIAEYAPMVEEQTVLEDNQDYEELLKDETEPWPNAPWRVAPWSSDPQQDVVVQEEELLFQEEELLFQEEELLFEEEGLLFQEEEPLVQEDEAEVEKSDDYRPIDKPEITNVELESKPAGQSQSIIDENSDNNQPVVIDEMGQANDNPFFEDNLSDELSEELPDWLLRKQEQNEEKKEYTQEELEYTQRLEFLSNDLLENTIMLDREGSEFDSNSNDWMANLAKSLGNDDVLPARENEESFPAEKELNVTSMLGKFTDDDSFDGDIMVISEAVIQSQDNDLVVESSDDELSNSILQNADEKKTDVPQKKKRRFPFF